MIGFNQSFFERNKNMLIDDLKRYVPYNEQERIDKEIIINFLERNIDAYTRDNMIAHVTVSSFVINKNKDKMIMAYHNIFDSFSWLGGHVDGELDLIKVAKKELMEESGLTSFSLLSEDIFSLEVLTVNGHIKNNQYVPSHLHLNITYLFEANELDELHIKEDENSEIRWFTFEEGLKASKEKWMKERIYSKLISKVRKLYF